MEETINKISVYIRTNCNFDIIEINSDIFIEDNNNYIKIDEGLGDKYAHAQGNYFDKPIMTDNGIYRYKYENGEVIEKSAEEIQKEISLLPKPEPTEIELLKTQVNTLTERNEFLEDCISEMALKIYE